MADIIGCDHVHANNVVRKNLAYVAEAEFDDLPVAARARSANPFGSYVEVVKYYARALLQDLRQHVIDPGRFVTGSVCSISISNPVSVTIALGSQLGFSYFCPKCVINPCVHAHPQGALMPQGPKAAHSDLGVSTFLPFVQEDLQNREVHESLRNQVLDRTLMYHRRCLPEQFLKENLREWEELCNLCEARAQSRSHGPKVPERPQYPFAGLLDQFADEWLDENLSIGGLESLRNDPIALSLEKWIGQAIARNKVFSTFFASAFDCG